jgi:hypothetical protein
MWLDRIVLMICIALLSSLIVSPPVCAEQSVTVEYGVYTTHLWDTYDDYDYNNDNNLIAFEYNNDRWYFNLATYNNSFNERSNAVGSGYNLYHGKSFDWDLLFGVASGYNSEESKTVCFGEFCIYAAPRVTYTYEVTRDWSIKPSAKLFYNAFNLGLGIEYSF